MSKLNSFYNYKDLNNLFKLENYKGYTTCSKKFPTKAIVKYPISKSIKYILSFENEYLKKLLILEINKFMLKNNLGSLIDNKCYYEKLKNNNIIYINNVLVLSSKL